MKILFCGLPNGFNLYLCAGDEVCDRINRAHFRGAYVWQAGNFRYRNLHTFLADPAIAAILEQTLRDAIQKHDGASRFREELVIQHPTRYVGWSQTDPKSHYRDSELETVALNDKCHASQVKRDTGRLAPLSDLACITCDLHVDEVRKEWIVYINSVHPGGNYGRRHGLLTERTGLVFFDPEHPGEPIP